MSFVYIDWVKKHFTKEQKANINMAENVYNRAVETASKYLDKDALFKFICESDYATKLADMKHRYFEITNARLNG